VGRVKVPCKLMYEQAGQKLGVDLLKYALPEPLDPIILLPDISLLLVIALCLKSQENKYL
jgi:hypothetical protein